MTAGIAALPFVTWPLARPVPLDEYLDDLMRNPAGRPARPGAASPAPTEGPRA